jgi:hypothetical protein
MAFATQILGGPLSRVAADGVQAVSRLLTGYSVPHRLASGILYCNRILERELINVKSTLPQTCHPENLYTACTAAVCLSVETLLAVPVLGEGVTLAAGP